MKTSIARRMAQASIITCAINAAAWGQSAEVELKLEKIPSIDVLYQKKLEQWSGGKARSIISAIKKSYPSYLIVGMCQASFGLAGRRDYGFSLINPELKIARYIAAIDRTNDVRFFELMNFEVSFSKAGYINGRGLEIICPSWTEVSRIKSDYQANASESGRYSDLSLFSNFDALCGSPTDGDMEFICYQYSNAKKQFVRVGGWKNE